MGMIVQIISMNVMIGLAIYYIPCWAYKLHDKKNSYNREDISWKMDREIYATRPKKEEELNLVPFEDALAVSDDVEKRSLLLRMMKKDMENNYKVTQHALEDSDSETSHYAAAAAMEIARKKKQKVQKVENEFTKNKDIPDIRRAFLDELYQYIDMGVLSGRDRTLHVNKYIQLTEETIRLYPELMVQSDYIHYLDYLIESNQLYVGEEIARNRKIEKPDEAIYEKLLDIYYRLKDQHGFEKSLKELQQSKVVLSATGLDMMRFWIARE